MFQVKLFVLLLCVCAILPGKAIPKMTYTVSGGTLNPTHSLMQTRCITYVISAFILAASSYEIFQFECTVPTGCWFRLELLGILCVFIYYSRFVFIFVIFSDSTSLPVVGVPTVVRKYRKNSRTAESSFQ